MKQWKKITEIIYLEDELEKEKKRSRENAPLITAKDAEKIIRCAAPFVQSLRSTYSESNGKQKFIMFGPYWFKVEGLKTYQTIKLLAQKATKITELRCDRAPRVELLQLLFENNKIKKLRVIECTAFYTNIPTEEIEDLDVRFIDRGDFRSFQGVGIHFLICYFRHSRNYKEVVLFIFHSFSAFPKFEKTVTCSRLLMA